MAFGKAIIASDCPSQENVINKERCGLIFNAGDAVDLADKIMELKNSEQFEDYGLNGMRAVIERYNTRMGNQALVDLYHDIENKL